MQSTIYTVNHKKRDIVFLKKKKKNLFVKFTIITITTEKKIH